MACILVAASSVLDLQGLQNMEVVYSQHFVYNTVYKIILQPDGHGPHERPHSHYVVPAAHVVTANLLF